MIGAERSSVSPGGWPCQGIAAAGHRRGVLGDRRSSLFYCLARLLEYYGPDYGFFENVGSIASQPESWQRVLSILADCGYNFKWVIIPVPNGLVYRKRFFLSASKAR